MLTDSLQPAYRLTPPSAVIYRLSTKVPKKYQHDLKPHEMTSSFRCKGNIEETKGVQINPFIDAYIYLLEYTYTIHTVFALFLSNGLLLLA